MPRPWYQPLSATTVEQADFPWVQVVSITQSLPSKAPTPAILLAGHLSEKCTISLGGERKLLRSINHGSKGAGKQLLEL